MNFAQIINLTLITIFLTFMSCKSVKNDCSVESENDYMKLKGNLEKLDNNSLKFSLKAQRLKQKDDEYLPNSENFRVEVYDKENSLIFNSDYGQNYLMVIGDVMPKEIGETYEYEYIWNKKNNYNKSVPKGKYSARLIIPSVPETYSISIDFEIE